MTPTLPRPALALAALAAALLAPVAARAQPAIDAPLGGWREAPARQRDFVQEVHYPASSVNIHDRSAAALIRGRIGAAPKEEADGAPRRPAQLIVDGVALPLRVAPDGGFARPWSFGRGSHGVEVRHGGETRRVQFHETQAARAGVRLRVVLSWDSDHTDLDLHVVSPDGAHVFYARRVAPNGGALDVDVTTGFGPEIYATPSPLPGVYHVYVNYYGAGERQDELTTAQVALIENEGTLAEKQQVWRVPLRKPGELTLVRSFRIP